MSIDRETALASIDSYRPGGESRLRGDAAICTPEFLVAVVAVIESLDNGAFPLVAVSAFFDGMQLDWRGEGRFLEVTLHADYTLSWMAGVEDDDSTWLDGWDTTWLSASVIVAAHRPRQVVAP